MFVISKETIWKLGRFQTVWIRHREAETKVHQFGKGKGSRKPMLSKVLLENRRATGRHPERIGQ